MPHEQAAALEAEIDAALAAADFSRAAIASRRYLLAAGPEPESVRGQLAASEWFRARYLAAQAALQAGRLTESLAHLVDLQRRLDELPPELATRLLLISAEARARRQDLEAARFDLNAADKNYAQLRRHPLLHMRFLRISLWLGDVKDVAQLLAECYGQLREDPLNHALLLCDEGRAWDEAGDLNRAVSCWHHADSLTRNIGAQLIRGDILLQLGRTAHMQGRFQEAIDYYDNALECSVAGTPQVVEIRLRRLLVMVELNRIEAARSEYRRLSERQNGHWPEELRWLADLAGMLLEEIEGHPETASAETRGWNMARRGHRREAGELYLHAYRQAQGPHRQARFALALGLFALEDHRADDAVSWLEIAAGLAREHRMPEVHWRALDGQGRLAAELQADDVRAKALYEQAISISSLQRNSLRNPTDAAAYQLHRLSLTRRLLRGACRRGDAAEVFRFQELERGRWLLDLWLSQPQREHRCLPGLPLELDELDRRLQESESVGGAESARGNAEEVAEWQRQRNRLLEDYVSNRETPDKTPIPRIPNIGELRRVLPASSVYLASSMIEDSLYLLAVFADGGEQLVFAAEGASHLRDELHRFRATIESQLRRYEAGFPIGDLERDELRACLDRLGEGPLGQMLRQVFSAIPKTPTRIVWVPDSELQGFPLHAIRLARRHLIEDYEVVFGFSGAWLVESSRRKRVRRRGKAVVVAESADQLPAAAEEARGVAASFSRSHLLMAANATRAAIGSHLPCAPALHIACHAAFDREQPLNAFVRLPSGELWRAVEWLDEPFEGLPLLVLSACRSAQTARTFGSEVFGLVCGALAAGVRNIVAGLWSVPDRETADLMWRFYRHRIVKDSAAALTLAQRELIASGDNSPLTWAVFAVFGMGDDEPPRWWWQRWWAERRTRLHRCQFPPFG